LLFTYINIYLLFVLQ